MNCRSQLKCGAAGSVLAAICCFTPVLAILLPAVGLAAWLGWADYVLLPLLVLFLALAAHGYRRMRRERAREGAPRGPSEAER